MKPLHRLIVGFCVLGAITAVAARPPSGGAGAGTPGSDDPAPYARALAIFVDDEVVGGTPADVTRLSTRHDQLISDSQGWDRALAATLTVNERESALTLGRKRSPAPGAAGPDDPPPEAVELARTLQDRFGYAHLPAVTPPAFDHWSGVPTRDRLRAILALLDETTVDRWRARRLLAITLRLLETQHELAATRREVRRLLPSLVPPN